MYHNEMEKIIEKVVKGDEVADYDDIVATSNLLRSSSDLEGTFSKTKSFSVNVYSTEKVTISCKVSGKYIYDKSRKRCLFGTLNKPKFTVKMVNGLIVDMDKKQLMPVELSL